ncbi:right-handed parallel beta-helix repeat-containing protein [Archangium primigenium]|uniref:right-handed parallel beta-helix repeat-containing protein n=1 Tax=[Archangium] primigenium TaxID=2792470 RepID=UPI00195BAE63|nr:right-handed parallel beta-helix repeat-containing protein [Archangium primigenium]MBM7118487.1 right-handed parallel beta-helix repeat-containing protein [Archangium primigenium]
MRVNDLARVVGLVWLAVGGVSRSQTFTVGDQCYLPGPKTEGRCTASYQVKDNPANNIVCLWSGDSVHACEGRTMWGGGFEWVSPPGATLEFRRHTIWPTQDPAWPDARAVRLKGRLLASKYVATVSFSPPLAPCGVVLSPGADIQAALDAGHGTVCLQGGLYPTAASVRPHANQTLRSLSPQAPAVLRRTAFLSDARVLEVLESNVTLKDLLVEGTATARPQYGVLVYRSGNVLLDNVAVSYALIGVGVNQSPGNVELRNTRVVSAGDGRACPGCAQPSVWITDSNNVRLMGGTFTNVGVGPEGDGELACYNTPNLLVQNVTVSRSGASGMYLVNCDRAMVLSNTIQDANEWGLDLVNTGQPSGTDFSLFDGNLITRSRHGGAVLKDSLFDTFQFNTYRDNRRGPNASGRCNGVNRRGNTTGFFQPSDSASPAPVSCDD